MSETIYCLHCGNLIYSKYSKKFCNSSCAASFNNSNRAPRSKESRLKTSLSMKASLPEKFPYTKITFNKCIICDREFFHKGPKKTCSNTCLNKRMKIIGTNNLRIRRAKGENFSFRRKSHLEMAFEKWLIQNGYVKSINGYLTEVYFRKPDTLYFYRADFVFPRYKLVIEIDGKQHEKSKEQDKLRDDALKSRGWSVERINYKHFNKSNPTFGDKFISIINSSS